MWLRISIKWKRKMSQQTNASIWFLNLTIHSIKMIDRMLLYPFYWYFRPLWYVASRYENLCPDINIIRIYGDTVSPQKSYCECQSRFLTVMICYLILTFTFFLGLSANPRDEEGCWHGNLRRTNAKGNSTTSEREWKISAIKNSIWSQHSRFLHLCLWKAFALRHLLNHW